MAPRKVRRFEFDITDATIEPDPGPPPEAVFDRLDRTVRPPSRLRGARCRGRGDVIAARVGSALRRTARIALERPRVAAWTLPR